MRLKNALAQYREAIFSLLEQKVLLGQESNSLFGEGFTVDSADEIRRQKNSSLLDN